MTFQWQNGLPFMSVQLLIGDSSVIVLHHVLIDTGAASSLFSIDKVFENGIVIEDSDVICKMVGIGGREHVIQRSINEISFADISVTNPTVQFGEMDYGFVIDGIIGADILRQIGAVINFTDNTIITGK